MPGWLRLCLFMLSAVAFWMAFLFPCPKLFFLPLLPLLAVLFFSAWEYRPCFADRDQRRLE